MAVSMETYVNNQVAYQNSGVREMSQIRNFSESQKRLETPAERAQSTDNTSGALKTESSEFLNAYTAEMGEMNQTSAKLAGAGASDMVYDDAGQVTGETVRETVAAVRDMADARNSGIRTLNDNMERGDGAYSQLARMVADPAPQELMAEVGVSVNNDGTLALDEERLAQALASNPEQSASILSGIADGIQYDAKEGLKTSAEELVNNDVAELRQANEARDTQAREDDPVRQMAQGQSGLGGNTLNNYMMAGSLLNMVV